MLKTLLQDGIASLGLSVNPEQINQLADYLHLMQKWNKAYNLTAITDDERMVSYHVLDSLALLNNLPENATCLDVGTGAGLPGIPLAIMRQDTHWNLIDSNGKKTRFVQQAISHCQLSNVKVVHTRVQDYHADSPFDVIVSRAYASLQEFVSSVDHLWQANTRLITMKTELSDAERLALSPQGYEIDITQLQIPGIDQQRSLVNIQRNKND